MNLTSREIQILREVCNYYLATANERFYHDKDDEIKVLLLKLNKKPSIFTPEETRLNQEEGWDLFLVDNSVYKIQKVDEKDMFHSNYAAFLYVNGMAVMRGSKRHIKAMENHDKKL